MQWIPYSLMHCMHGPEQLKQLLIVSLLPESALAQASNCFWKSIGALALLIEQH